MAGIAGTIILLLSAVAFLLARDCRNKKKEMEVLLQRLDDALNGEVEASAYDESLDSAITERLDKPLRSSSMGKERAYQDRDRIKSLLLVTGNIPDSHGTYPRVPFSSPSSLS